MAHYAETVTKRIDLFPYIYVKNFIFFQFYLFKQHSYASSQKGGK